MTKKTEKAEMPQIKHSKTDDMFVLVKGKEGVRIAIGNYQVSKKVFKSFADADAYIAEKPYEIIVNVTCLFTEMRMKNENSKESTKNA